MPDFLNPLILIKVAGLVGVLLIVFAESGLLIGFFLPGDSLLFTAGFLASQHHISFPLLVIGSMLAAIIGDSVGYAFGKKVGQTLFHRQSSRFFNPENVARAQEFYKTHGRKTIILARFVPVIRTFAPIVAGIGEMEYRVFLTYNMIGGVLWAGSMTTLGYVLGKTVPDVDKYILPIVILIIVISVAPGAYHYFTTKKKKKAV